MSDDHIIKLPIWVWILKIIQAVIAVLVLGFSAYGVHWIAFDAYALALFTALFTMLILTYYFVSLHFVQVAYNWIAVLVLESLAVVFWLASFADLADTYRTGADAVDSGDYLDTSYVYYYYKNRRARRDPYTGVLEKRDTTDFDTYVDVFRAAIAFSVIQWILYVITLVFIAIGVKNHRAEGKPMVAGGARTTDEEKIEVQNVPAANPAPTQTVHEAA